MKVDEIVEKEVCLPLALFSARHAFLFIAKKDVRERESFLYSYKADSNNFSFSVVNDLQGIWSYYNATS